MNTEQRDRAINVMQMIQTDVETDSRRREGMEFTGRNVSVALGEIAAQVGAIARAVELLLREHERAQA